MKFDKVYNELFEKLGLNEMAIHLYNTDPEDAAKNQLPASANQSLVLSRAPKTVGIDTSEGVMAHKARFKSVFISELQKRAGKRASGHTEHGTGYALTDLVQAVINTVPDAVSNGAQLPPVWLGLDEEQQAYDVYNVFADIWMDLAFPGGRNSALTWEDFQGAKTHTSELTQQALIETHRHFSELFTVQVVGGITRDASRRKYLLTNVIKSVLRACGARFSEEDGADYLEGTMSKRGRQSKAAIEAERTQGGFTMHQEKYQQINEMPVRIKSNIAGERGVDTVKRSMKHAFSDKHQRVNDHMLSTNVSQHQKDGSNTYHVGELARHLGGNETVHSVTDENIQKACEIFANIIHEKMFQVWEDGVNPAETKQEFRKFMTHAVEEALSIIESEYGSDIFSTISPSFTARVIDNGLEYLTARVWKKKKAAVNEQEGDDEEDEDVDDNENVAVSEKKGDEDDDEDDESEDDEDDDESEDEDDFAYSTGILSDEDEESEKERAAREKEEQEEREEREKEQASRPSEDEEEESADVIASRIERAGSDIARLFLQALDEIENEEDSEEDDIVDDEIGTDDSNDIRSYLGSSNNFEDEEEERYRGWGDFNQDEY